MWVAVSWDSGWCWAWAASGTHCWHCGGPVPLGHATPCCIHWFHCSPDCHTPIPENTLNILGEHPNTTLLSPWEQKASRFGVELRCLTGAPAAAQQDWKCISVHNTLTWLLSVLFFFPWQVRQAERFAGEHQGVNVGVLFLTHWLPFYFKVEQ